MSTQRKRIYVITLVDEWKRDTQSALAKALNAPRSVGVVVGENEMHEYQVKIREQLCNYGAMELSGSAYAEAISDPPVGSFLIVDNGTF